ncbi:MAG: helix-turn-helix domain-containing protein [Muribaculaceae bacterium]|nr:helix-turn-helix domain-containing protein [Muribaculaceae bacterium]
MEQTFIYDDVRLPPQRQIPIHTQNEWELSYVVCGHGVMFIGEDKQRFCEGEVVLIPPQIPHGWFFDNNSTDGEGYIHNITLLFASDLPERLSYVLPEWARIANVLSDISVPRRYVGKAAEEIAGLLDKMRAMDASRRLPLILQLLIIITENAESEEIGSKPVGRSEKQFEKFGIYCKCNFYTRITLGDTAAYMDMNRCALCKFVKKHTGQTFTEYINSLRLEKAAQLLVTTTDSACDIAYDCGFTSIPYFHRLFSRKYGMTPCGYRKGKR